MPEGEFETAPCPTCGRSVSLRDGACPYDGTPVDSATAIAVASTINPSLKLDAAPDVAEIIGERFGKYVVDEVLGRGGMGTVYRVTHADLGNKFALKVMDHRIVGSAEAHTRFLREARAAARIDHPNVIRVLDHARHPTFGSYLVMELLSGRSLDTILAADRMLSESRAIAIAVQICEALGAAHEGGIVHRDLKPANVFIIRVRGEEVVKVMDFGVAKVAADATTLLTRPGTVIGTPLYMSPEQWDNVDIDARSDVYSFGVLLYEMVTGRMPVRGSGITEVAKNLATTTPTAPRLLRPELSPAIEAVIIRCLEKKAGDRFPSMRDVADALGRASTEAGARPPIHGQPSLRRRGAMVLGLVAALLAIVAARASFTRTRDPRARASEGTPVVAESAMNQPPLLDSSAGLTPPASEPAGSVTPAPSALAPVAESNSAVLRLTPRLRDAGAVVPASRTVGPLPPASARRPSTPTAAASKDELFGE